MATQRDLSALVNRKREKEADGKTPLQQAGNTSKQQGGEKPPLKKKTFRIEKPVAKRLEIMAKQEDTTETALLYEALDLLFEKRGTKS
jgi:hypothetical protein